MGGKRVTKEHVNGKQSVGGRHHSCINDTYLQEAVNIIQAKAQTVHEALHTAKENQKLSEQFRTFQVTSRHGDHDVGLCALYCDNNKRDYARSVAVPMQCVKRVRV